MVDDGLEPPSELLVLKKSAIENRSGKNLPHAFDLLLLIKPVLKSFDCLCKVRHVFIDALFGDAVVQDGLPMGISLLRRTMGEMSQGLQNSFETMHYFFFRLI